MKKLLRSIFSEVHPFWFTRSREDSGEATRTEALEEIIRANPWVHRGDASKSRQRQATRQITARKTAPETSAEPADRPEFKPTAGRPRLRTRPETP